MHRLNSATIGLALLSTVFTAEPAQAQSGCAVRLGQPSIDFGAMTRGQLLQQPLENDLLSFGRRRVQITVQCERPAALRLDLAAPAADAVDYRFGAGTLRVHVLAVRVDGKAVQWLGFEPGVASGVAVWPAGQSLIPARAGVALEGQRMDVEVELEGRVGSAQTRVADLTRFEIDVRFNAY
ncbi:MULTISPECIES: hypothetical protein [Pseudomonas]|uniref:hypothetical protein n=1 Tax=Pseudomonas TaxID=286 RepID=UPI001D064E4C|nr:MULTISPECIES: hypothetical protein [Pseudomonas]MCX4219988.1 hypothetical protein [Pseudomonas sp. MCal1]UDI92804.1 hypothetical protein I5961_27500 [Pseudomonas sp. IAC-BECa141]UIN56342.1 hypothetical protein LXN51_08415 [Pseudomonas kribbensis]